MCAHLKVCPFVLCVVFISPGTGRVWQCKRVRTGPLFSGTCSLLKAGLILALGTKIHLASPLNSHFRMKNRFGFTAARTPTPITSAIRMAAVPQGDLLQCATTSCIVYLSCTCHWTSHSLVCPVHRFQLDQCQVPTVAGDNHLCTEMSMISLSLYQVFLRPSGCRSAVDVNV